MADRYWVNGTGNWSDTNKWSVSSGGSGGASVPTTADNVFFDNASAAGTFTVTITAGSACANFDASGITDPAKKMSLGGASTGSLSVAGSWINPTSTFYASTFSSTPITFSSTTTGKTIRTNGVTFASVGNANVTFNGVGGGWQLLDAFTLSGINAIVTLTNGALDLNGFTLTTGYWISNNSNTRSIAFGSTGSISVYTTAAGAVWSMATATGFSYTGNSSVLISGNPIIQHGSTAGGTEANALNFTYTGSTSGGPTSNSRFRNLTFSSYSGTFIFAVIVYGDFLVLNSPSMSFSAAAAALSFSGSGAQNITTAGKSFDQPITFNGTGTVTLVDGLTVAVGRLITFSSGTLNLNNQALTIGPFATTGAVARVLAFGASGTITISSSFFPAWNASGSNFTSTGTGTISMTSASAKTFAGGGFNYAATLNQGGAGTLTISGNNTFQNITNTYGATGATTITFTASTTQTVSAFTASGTSGNQLTLNSSTAGTRFNLSDASGVVSVSFCNIQDSNATGGATWKAATASGNVSVSNNAGWNFGQYYWVGGSGTWNNTNAANWSTSSGGAGGSGPPTATDTVVFDASSGTGTCTTAATAAGYDVILNSSTLGLTLGAGLTILGAFTLSQGTINLAGLQLSCFNFSSNNANTRSVVFGTSGIFVVTGATTGSGAAVWAAGGSNFTSTGTTSIIRLSSSSAKTFAGGGLNYAATLDQGGAGTLTISGNNTFQSISNTYNLVAATTITFTAASTQTITRFEAYGSGNKALTLNSSTPGTKFNLVATRGTIDVSYCRISDSSVSGGARWQAYNTQGNVNVSGNVGWNFVRRSARTFMKLRVKSI